MWPAVFLDRDGVINENREDYVKSCNAYVFLPSIIGPLMQRTREILSLPMYPELEDGQIERVVAEIGAFFDTGR